MNIWPVTAVLSGQSRLGGSKIRIILNKALILHYDSCVLDRDLKKILVKPIFHFLPVILPFSSCQPPNFKTALDQTNFTCSFLL